MQGDADGVHMCDYEEIVEQLLALSVDDFNYKFVLGMRAGNLLHHGTAAAGMVPRMYHNADQSQPVRVYDRLRR